MKIVLIIEILILCFLLMFLAYTYGYNHAYDRGYDVGYTKGMNDEQKANISAMHQLYEKIGLCSFAYRVCEKPK